MACESIFHLSSSHLLLDRVLNYSQDCTVWSHVALNSREAYSSRSHNTPPALCISPLDLSQRKKNKINSPLFCLFEGIRLMDTCGKRTAKLNPTLELNEGHKPLFGSWAPPVPTQPRGFSIWMPGENYGVLSVPTSACLSQFRPRSIGRNAPQLVVVVVARVDDLRWIPEPDRDHFPCWSCNDHILRARPFCTAAWRQFIEPCSVALLYREMRGS